MSVTPKWSLVVTAVLAFLFCAAAIEADPKGNVIAVPGDFKGIQEAIDAAPDGGTVLVKAGVYEIARPIDLKAGITLLGEGADKTVLAGSAALRAAQDPEKGSLVVVRDRTRVSRLCLRGAGAFGIYVRGVSDEVKSAAIDHTVITGCQAGIVCNNQYNDAGVLRLTNNTIAACGIGVTDNDWNEVVMSGNAVYGCKVGVRKFNVLKWTAEYNLVFACDKAWDGLDPSATNLARDPLFIDDPGLDFHLAAGSPCIDSGMPDAGANDPDGSRNDIGALSFAKR